MASSSHALTFRLRRVPAYVEHAQLAAFLAKSVEGLGLADNVHILSLAPTPGDWSNPPSQTATLQFSTTPERFRTGLENQWTIGLQGQRQSLIFDTHFLGFTPLNKIDASTHAFDCIAISGLASHPFGSWKCKDRTSPPDPSHSTFMWLRDQLPTDFPDFRILTYGYDTTLVGSESFQTIDDLALDLIAQLRAIGGAELSAKPVCFLVHSLGGIVLKRALYYLANSSEAEDVMLRNVRLILFFGVPNKGMEMSYLVPMVSGQPNEALVKALSPTSTYLLWLDTVFSGVAVHRKIRLISAFETARSQIAVQSSDGRWERIGNHEILVSKESAIQAGSRVPEDVFPINRDHSSLVKLLNDDPSYSKIVYFIRETMSKPVVAAWSLSSTGLALSPVSKLMKSFWHLNSKAASIPPGSTPISMPAPQKSSDSSGACLHSVQIATRVGDAARTPQTTNQAPQQKGIDKIHGLSRSPGSKASNPLLTSKALKQSLGYPEQSFRFKDIETAQETTFDWVFDSKLGFLSWLHNSNGLYWIRGKPGSGKSTLMKHVRAAIQDNRVFSPWKPQDHQIDVWFFFHERGSYLQKSFEGLMRTILRELVSRNADLAEMVLKLYDKKDPNTRDLWTYQDLNEVFNFILTQKDINIEIILFLDALDEYNGFPEIIADFLKQLSVKIPETERGTHIKICFSSRPWDVFVENFDDCQGFKLHDHTSYDIRHYAAVRLSEIESLRPYLNLDPGPQQGNLDKPIHLLDSITTRAEGVFLWVKLVVDDLKQSGDQTSPAELEQILLGLPDDLGELYERTIERIPPTSRLDAFVMLEIVLRSFKPLTIKELYRASGCALGQTFADCRAKLSEIQRSAVSEPKMALLLKNLCGGLIEVVTHDFDFQPSEKVVQFIHRTVKDFVGRPGFQRQMLGRYHEAISENGHSFFMKYYIVLEDMVALGTESWKPSFITSGEVEVTVTHAHLAEVSTGRHFAKFLDSVPGNVIKNFTLRASRTQIHHCNSALAFGVLADLRLYVKAKILGGPPTTIVNSNPGISLLHYAVAQPLMYIRFETVHIPIADMIKLLLSAGAHLNTAHGKLTPFQSLFSLAYHMFERTGWIIYDLTDMANMTKAFLAAGQFPDVELYDMISGERKGFVCRPLHVSCGGVTRMLLEHGAEVNTLDSRGRTPLDICIGAVGDLIDRQPNEVLETTRLLLQYGGGITVHGEKVLGKFVHFMIAHFTSIPQNFRSPPRLPKTTSQKLRSLLPVRQKKYP